MPTFTVSALAFPRFKLSANGVARLPSTSRSAVTRLPPAGGGEVHGDRRARRLRHREVRSAVAARFVGASHELAHEEVALLECQVNLVGAQCDCDHLRPVAIGREEALLRVDVEIDRERERGRQNREVLQEALRDLVRRQGQGRRADDELRARERAVVDRQVAIGRAPPLREPWPFEVVAERRILRRAERPAVARAVARAAARVERRGDCVPVRGRGVRRRVRTFRRTSCTRRGQRPPPRGAARQIRQRLRGERASSSSSKGYPTPRLALADPRPRAQRQSTSFPSKGAPFSRWKPRQASPFAPLKRRPFSVAHTLHSSFPERSLLSSPVLPD